MNGVQPQGGRDSVSTGIRAGGVVSDRAAGNLFSTISVYMKLRGMVIITHATSATKTSATAPKNPFRGVVFTVFAQDEGVPTPLDWEFMKTKLTYFAYGDEICPTTGRAHHQGFAYARTAMRFGAWVELLNHIEENSYIDFREMKGSFKSNEVYCSKEGKLKEFGERPKQGKRTDLIEVKKLIDSGKPRWK